MLSDYQQNGAGSGQIRGPLTVSLGVLSDPADRQSPPNAAISSLDEAMLRLNAQGRFLDGLIEDFGSSRDKAFGAEPSTAKAANNEPHFASTVGQMFNLLDANDRRLMAVSDLAADMRRLV